MLGSSSNKDSFDLRENLDCFLMLMNTNRPHHIFPRSISEKVLKFDGIGANIKKVIQVQRLRGQKTLLEALGATTNLVTRLMVRSQRWIAKELCYI